jgi:hypothetical protein
MASTLNRTGDSAPQVDKRHGTRALGPSDSSDSGSDIAGRDAAEPDRDRLPDRVEGEPSLDVGSVADLAEDADPTDADVIDDESIDAGSAGDEPPRLP